MLRVKFTKEDYLKYISHLDLMRLFNRTFRRAGIPIKYTEGFNPQPKFSIANPLALGIESISEYMDIDLEEEIPVEDFIKRMNDELPKQIRILEGKYIEDDRSLSSLVGMSHYEISFSFEKLEDEIELKELIDKWLEKDEIIIKKIKRKRGKIKEREQNIRPLIGNILINSQCAQSAELNCLLKSGDRGNLKPMDLIDAMDKEFNLNIDSDSIEIKRISLFLEDDGKIQLPI